MKYDFFLVDTTHQDKLYFDTLDLHFIKFRYPYDVTNKVREVSDFITVNNLGSYIPLLRCTSYQHVI